MIKLTTWRKGRGCAKMLCYHEHIIFKMERFFAIRIKYGMQTIERQKVIRDANIYDKFAHMKLRMSEIDKMLNSVSPEKLCLFIFSPSEIIGGLRFYEYRETYEEFCERLCAFSKSRRHELDAEQSSWV